MNTNNIWHNVEDEKPEDGKMVIILSEDNHTQVGSYYASGECVYYQTVFDIRLFNKWCYLDDTLPKKEKQLMPSIDFNLQMEEDSYSMGLSGLSRERMEYIRKKMIEWRNE